MKTAIVTLHYNNPEFIKYQLRSFERFIIDRFEYIVVDDSQSETRSLLSGNNAGTEIDSLCSELGLRKIRIPQTIHARISSGGLVPNNLPANHPTERHRATLHYILKNISALELDQFDLLVLGESDMFFRKPINLSEYMEDFDILGTSRKNELIKIHNDDWPEELREKTEVLAEWFTMYLTFFNLRTVKNLHEFNVGGFAGSDTGGLNHFFRKKNNYKYGQIQIGSNKDCQVDFFSKTTPSEEHCDVVHYRGGSNWDHQTPEYYREKMIRMFKRFIPDLYNGEELSQVVLESRDGEHRFE